MQYLSPFVQRRGVAPSYDSTVQCVILITLTRREGFVSRMTYSAALFIQEQNSSEVGADVSFVLYLFFAKCLSPSSMQGPTVHEVESIASEHRIPPAPAPRFPPSLNGCPGYMSHDLLLCSPDLRDFGFAGLDRPRFKSFRRSSLSNEYTRVAAAAHFSSPAGM